MSDMFVGVTDNEWFKFLRERKPDEVNFWRPSGQPFKALQPGGLFFFKLHAPYKKLAGWGVFVRYSVLPLKIAWEAFGEKNGVATLEQLQKRIMRYRRDRDPNPMIGCIILAQPIFHHEDQWIEQPKSWAGSIVVGKGFAESTAEGKYIYGFAEERLRVEGLDLLAHEPDYARRLQKVRLGQGGFRILVTEAYSRRCAISGERTLPVLEAAHIMPYSKSGPHRVENGLLLRSDLHKLFDEGYVTITDKYQVEVSKRIKEEFENGRDYYRYHGKQLIYLPESVNERPTIAYLNWHNTEVYRG
jgi:HNH endonuclease